MKRVLAQTEINLSNSLIESWRRILKHQWLYLNTLDTVATVEKLLTFYVEQHNVHLPHSAFHASCEKNYKGNGSSPQPKYRQTQNLSKLEPHRLQPSGHPVCREQEQERCPSSVLR